MPAGRKAIPDMATAKRTRQRDDTIEENHIGIDRQDAELLVRALNDDLANAIVLSHQVRKHHWVVEGAESLELHRFLEDAYETLESGADAIAERIHALGGVPVSGPSNLETRAAIDHEGESIYDARSMLENDMEDYETLLTEVRSHVEMVEDLGDYGTAELLREYLLAVEQDAHHVQQYLEDDTLVLERATR